MQIGARWCETYLRLSSRLACRKPLRPGSYKYTRSIRNASRTVEAFEHELIPSLMAESACISIRFSVWEYLGVTNLLNQGPRDQGFGGTRAAFVMHA